MPKINNKYKFITKWTSAFIPFLGAAVLVCFGWGQGICGTAIEFKMIWKSPELINGSPAIIGTSDLDGNGNEELFMTDFSNEAYIIRGLAPQGYHFLLLEWNGKSLAERWNKKWTYSGEVDNKYYDFFRSLRWVNVWKFLDHQVMEAMAPFFRLQWKDGAFLWEEQYGKKDNRHDVVASWTFPFQKFSCLSDDLNFFAGTVYPNECLMAVRDFGPKIGVRVISMVTKDLMTDQRVVKVRNPNNKFSVDWEGLFPDRPNLLFMVDPFGVKSPPFVQYRGRGGNRWHFLLPKGNDKDYEVKTLKADGELWRNLPIDVREIKAGRTKHKDQWEYWGYRLSQGYDDKPIFDFQKTYPNNEMTRVLKEEISFPMHDRFIGIGHFSLEDLDGDGLDEIIYIEQTGVREGSHGYTYKNVEDYVRVSKWDGKAYKIIWTSPPLKERGSKVLVADLLGIGKKQIIVCTGNGTVEIWERK